MLGVRVGRHGRHGLDHPKQKSTFEIVDTQMRCSHMIIITPCNHPRWWFPRKPSKITTELSFNLHWPKHGMQGSAELVELAELVEIF